MGSHMDPSPESGGPLPLSGREVERYSRQLLLPSFGPGGQERLRGSSALIVGAGGLGCPAALYLAGAGVGTLGLAEKRGEAVELSNLHRQVLHTTAGAAGGLSKAESARAALGALNPGVRVVLHGALAPADAVAVATAYDVVLDCTDNVSTRYLASDACAAARVPLISGAALGLDGQLSVYGGAAPDAPCLRCVFPAPPPPACVGTCDAAGVLGPVVGTIGVLMALEAVKLLARVDGARSLAGRLLLFDGAAARFRDVKLRPRDPACPACGDLRSIDVATFDYAAFANGGAQVPAKKAVLADEFRISVRQFASMREKKRKGNEDFFLLDCRPANQYAVCSLDDCENVPLSQINDKVGERLQKLNKPIVVLCRRGNKSQTATVKLQQMGLNQVVDVRGGLQAWHHEIDDDFPLY